MESFKIRLQGDHYLVDILREMYAPLASVQADPMSRATPGYTPVEDVQFDITITTGYRSAAIGFSGFLAAEGISFEFVNG